MNKINYQNQLDRIIENISPEKPPRLLLHSCCAPCSSYTLEYLSRYFDITVYYFNPNISPKQEFDKRFEEQKRLISQMPFKNRVTLVEGDYNYDDFLEIAKGLENVPEGGERCFRCYKMRLESTARLAKEQGFDYFCTTLSISPLKNSQKINELGFEIEKKYGVKWLPSDFKKREGYKRSIQLSREYSLYRQNFCGCVFSKNQQGESNE
ncbi:MAG: epoxyqueuosine reductase QueH [Eubacteriales bacterium]|nr:epoxyqueuosine reductase QueH [Eubacteriales bacterium]